MRVQNVVNITAFNLDERALVLEDKGRRYFSSAGASARRVMVPDQCFKGSVVIEAKCK